MEKNTQIREWHRKRRGSMTDEEMLQASEQLAERLENETNLSEVAQLYAYYPCGKEASLLPFLQKLFEKGKRVAFPRVNGDDMTFYEVSALSQFSEGSFHIMEPVSERAVCSEQAVVLVPGMVFDEKGNRMGYGKGYYDRYFHENSVAARIGIAYEHQIEKSMEPQPWDVPMDVIVTEKKIRVIRPENLQSWLKIMVPARTLHAR